MANTNKAKELDWWLALGQADLVTMQDKTTRKYLTELENMINDPLNTASWNTAKLKPYQLHQAINALKDTIKTLRSVEGVVESSYTVKVKVDRKEFNYFPHKADVWVDTEQDIETLVVAMLLRAIHEAKLEHNQIKECYCGNLFIQFGKRVRVYCSKKCRTTASIKRSEEAKESKSKIQQKED